MFTEPPTARSASSSRAEASASVVWCWVPQSSNQPHQNSMHISGPVGWNSRSVARRSGVREPNEPVRCRPGRLPSASICGVGWSMVVSGTVTPASRVTRTSSARYSLSEPYAPYSFSICTRTTGPPRSICRGATIA
ncbi:hypothetical protein ASF46_00900 [Rathayibacter sp. Leaf296]|nr:hypothetical protein ASF46_00900 [Rathayibacter sp. Leaf296]